MHLSSRLLSLLIVAPFFYASHARAQALPAPHPVGIKLESGAVYSRGDYGLTEDTTVFVVPFSLSYDAGPWVFQVTQPWVSIKGPANVVGDTTTGTAGPVRPTTDRENGLGDSTLGLTYKLSPSAEQLNIDLTGRVKLPTGDDERGIGTGATDTYVQVDLYRTFGSITPFGSIGYRWLGDGRYQLENGAYVSGGVLYTLAPGTSVGVSYEWREAIVAGGDDSSEAALLLFRRLNARWNASLSLQKGFTDASADFGIGTQISYSF